MAKGKKGIPGKQSAPKKKTFQELMEGAERETRIQDRAIKRDWYDAQARKIIPPKPPGKQGGRASKGGLLVAAAIGAAGYLASKYRDATTKPLSKGPSTRPKVPIVPPRVSKGTGTSANMSYGEITKDAKRKKRR